MIRSIIISAALAMASIVSAGAQAPPFNASSIATLGGACTNAGAIPRQVAGGVTTCLAPGSHGTILKMISGVPTWSVVSGTGTVTSVGATVPSEFAVAGVPITSSGTIAISKSTQGANTVWAAPNGAAGVPTFRALSAGDLPAFGSGDVSCAVGGGACTIASSAVTSGTIASKAATNAKLADMPAHTVKSNPSGATAAPVDATITAILDDAVGNSVGAVIARGGAWQSTTVGARGDVMVSTGGASAPVWLASDAAELRRACYIGDGASHPLSTVTSCYGLSTVGYSLAQWQALLPSANALTDEVDWASIQSALTAKGGVSLPPHTHAVLNSPITCPATNCAIAGTGSADTVLEFTAALGAPGISMTAASEGSWMQIRGLRISTTVDQSTPALRYLVPSEVIGYSRPFVANDIVIASARVYPMGNHWSGGIELENANFAEISGFAIFGRMASSADLNAPPVSNMNFGIYIHTPAGPPGMPSSDAIKISNGLIVASNYGISLNNDAEQVRINSVDMVAVNTGVDQYAASGASCVYAADNHVNAFTVGFSLNGCATGRVDRNLIFLNPPATTTAYGLVVKSSNRLGIDGNQIHNISAGAGIVTEGVNIDVDSYANSATHNLCSALDHCVNSNNSTSILGTNSYVANVMHNTPTFDPYPATNAVYALNRGIGSPENYPTISGATPNISRPSSVMQTGNASATDVTSFANDTFAGEETLIKCSDLNTTYKASSRIYTLSGGDVSCAVLGLGRLVGFKTLGGGVSIQTR